MTAQLNNIEVRPSERHHRAAAKAHLRGERGPTHPVKARELLARVLYREADKSTDQDRAQAMLNIATKIEGCEENWRCCSAACPECISARQEWFVATAPKAILQSAAARGSPALATVTIVPPLRLSHGASLRHIKEQAQRIISAVNCAVVASGAQLLVGAYDISANTDLPGDRAPAPASLNTRYQIHLWGIGHHDDLSRAAPALRMKFPSTKSTRSPVRVQRFDGGTQGYAYALKPDFSCRQSLPATVTTDPEADCPNRIRQRRKNTRLKAPTAAQRAEIALILDALGYSRRFLIHGASIVVDDDGAQTIEPNFPWAGMSGGGVRE